MIFSTFGRFVTAVVTVCLITATTPVSAQQISPSDGDLGIEAEDIEHHLDLADEQLQKAGSHKASSVSFEKFDKNLSKTLDKMSHRTNKKLDRMSEKKAEKEFNKISSLYSSNGDQSLKDKIAKIDAKPISYKEKLRELNGDSYKNEVHDSIMGQVKAAGSVRAFVKQLRVQLKAQRALQKANDNSEAKLKIKTNTISSKDDKRIPASDDSGKAGGISVGGLLLITGIILVVLGAGTVGATWVTVGWVFIVVFGFVPVAILLVVLLVMIIVAISASVKIEELEFIPFDPMHGPKLIT